MEYGILVVRCDKAFQIIGSVSSLDEAKEMATGFSAHFKYGQQLCFPERFEIHRRDSSGYFNVIEGFTV